MEITVLIITAAISSTVSAAVGGALAWVKGKEKAMKEHKQQEQEQLQQILEVLKTLTHDSYFACCKNLVDEDAITDADFENFTRLYNSYKALGMNGKGEWYHHQIENKPIKTE